MDSILFLCVYVSFARYVTCDACLLSGWDLSVSVSDGLCSQIIALVMGSWVLVCCPLIFNKFHTYLLESTG